MSDSAPPVACTATHTTETFLVTDVPSRYASAERRPGFDVRPDMVAEMCIDPLLRIYLLVPQFQGLFGVRVVGFLPTQAAWRDGARWLRCDIVLSEFDERLAPWSLTASVAGVMATDVADRFSKCYQQEKTASGGLTSEGSAVRCTEPHSSRDVNNWFTTVLEPNRDVVLEGCTDAVVFSQPEGSEVGPDDVTATIREEGSRWVVQCAVVESDE